MGCFSRKMKVGIERECGTWSCTDELPNGKVIKLDDILDPAKSVLALSVKEECESGEVKPVVDKGNLYVFFRNGIESDAMPIIDYIGKHPDYPHIVYVTVREQEVALFQVQWRTVFGKHWDYGTALVMPKERMGLILD